MVERDKMSHNIEMNLKSVAFLTLGCKVNSYETEAMQKLFEDAGYQVVDFNQCADVYVVNTCTVTNIADRKSRQMLHKARKKNEAATVVAVGCYVQAAKEALEQDETIDIVIGNNKKKEIIQMVEEYRKGIETSKSAVLDISQEDEFEMLSIVSVSEKTRAYIKIQDGCNQFCSYCIIPYMRGRVRSRDENSIIQEVEQLVSNGYKEIVLTGIHLSSYGIERVENNGNPSLLQLIVKLSKINGLERIRLGSLEPRIITEEFVKTLSSNTKFCPHFHLSLQSGCDATLARMNRKYTTKEYYDKCELLRKYFLNPAITTDVIVGFPGETEEEFLMTYEFLRKVSFSQMHIFKYSVRKGTKAETMPNQVKDEDKTLRSNRLIVLEKEMAREFKSLFIGNIENILVEETQNIDGINYQVGHNERYLKMAVKSQNDLNNHIIKGTITGELNKEILFCEIMD
ncbi:MAG: MiaB-like tRNA modifying enzyme [Anaerocolumna sp.]|jgi:threonylcarbamoyladenosine tRNA methylthiotransferase MtaB|nr:MiaB-like tRNA modifying enzyme [Anaerocolumna sp.]